MKEKTKSIAGLWFWISLGNICLSLVIIGALVFFRQIDESQWLSRVDFYEDYQLQSKKWEEEKGQTFEFFIDEESVVLPKEFWVELEDLSDYEKRAKASIVYVQKQSLWRKMGAYMRGISIESPVNYKPDVLLAYAQQKGLIYHSFSAPLVWDEANQIWVLGQERDEKTLNKNKITEVMKDAFWNEKSSAKLTSSLRAPSPSRQEMASAWEEVVVLKGQDLKLSFEESAFNFPVKTWMAGMTYEKGIWVLKANRLQDSTWQEFLETMEQEARHVIISEENGKIKFSDRPQEGREVDLLQLNQKFKEALDKGAFPEKIELTLKIKEVVVEIPESLKARGIQDYIGSGYSNFAGSPVNRVHNIGVGMRLFNGYIIAKGEVFSFTENMGPIDAAHGWLPELVIVGDETKPEYGGGLCQVSSTMFRAVLYTGLPVVERHEHSYAVSYYARPNGWGLDASVYDPSPDFKFKNDTAGDLLVQAWIEGSNAYFIFYGTKDGRRVEMEGPSVYGHYRKTEPVITQTKLLKPGERKLDQAEHVGFKADWWRTIFYADGTQSKRENFHSNYEARPAKYLEGAPEAVEGTGLDATPNPAQI